MSSDLERRAPLERRISPVRAYLASLAPTGRRSQETALRAILDVAAPGAEGLTVDGFPWEKLRSEHTHAIRAALVPKYAPRTVNKILAALKGVLKECWRQRLIDEADYRHASDLKGLRVSDHARAGRRISVDEMRALYEAAQTGPSAAHDVALLAVLYNCGLRRAEVCALNVGDYGPVDHGLIVHGKGSKQREAFLPTAGALRFEAWWRTLDDEAAPVFVRWGSRGPGGRLWPDEVGILVEKIRVRAGVAPFTTHDFRRTYITTLLERDVDLKTVSALVGHSNINTTALYDRRGREDRKKAVTKFPGL